MPFVLMLATLLAGAAGPVGRDLPNGLRDRRGIHAASQTEIVPTNTGVYIMQNSMVVNGGWMEGKLGWSTSKME